jgi:hypothetical protein
MAAGEKPPPKRRHTRPAKWRRDEDRRMRREAEAREAARLEAQEVKVKAADQAVREALQGSR